MNFTMYNGFTSRIQKEGIEKATEYAVRLGFSSVEMLVSCLTGVVNPISDIDSAKEARAVLERHGLSVACYSAYVDIWQNESAVQKAMEMTEIAGVLGSPYFHHTLLPGSPLAEDAPVFEDAISAAADAAERIARHAEKFGITCLYEDQGFYVNGVEGFGIFFREMKRRCRNVGVCGDLGNILFVNERPEDFLRAYGADIRHVHVKDYLWKEAEVTPGMYWAKAKGKSWLRETMVGHGMVNIGACMKVLKETGYNGAFALELGHPEPFENGVRQAMECLQACW